MRTPYQQQAAEQIEIVRRIRQGTVEIGSPKIFGQVARILWRDKTAAQLAAIAGTNERAAWRWLSGEHEPPISVVIATMQKIFGNR